jgi:hypothetical protein
VNLIAKRSGGSNVVGRPQARAPWYPSERSRPVRVDVWWRHVGEPAAAARKVGTFSPGQEVSYPFNPLVDRDIILSSISVSPQGVPSVRDIADAPETLLVFQRETAAPTVTEVRPIGSSNNRITLAIDGYSSLAIKRRIRTADDEDMTVNLVEQEFTVASPADTLPRVVYLDRVPPSVHARTIWVRIAHSSGGEYGAESVATAFTYSDADGADGSGATADGDPWGQGRFDT